LRIALVAGEASGDQLGAELVASLRARLPGAELVGIGGPRMIAAGLEAWYPQEALAVRGLVEVLRHLRRIVAIKRGLLARLRAEPVDLYVGIDAPDFNLRIERALRRRGVRTVHYVGPTVWGWRKGRIKGIRKAVSHLLALFPFEAPVFERGGVPATFVGHPLARDPALMISRTEARELLRLPETGPVVALLPGSRVGEIEMMAPVLIEAARRIHQARPEVQFVVPLATAASRDAFEACRWRLEARELPIRTLFGHASQALVASEVSLVTSGTATLQAALAGTAPVVSYRLSPLTWALVRRLVRVRAVGLPNLLLGEFVAPELLQAEATADNLAQVGLNLLADPALRERLRRRFAVLRGMLEEPAGASAADVVIAQLAVVRGGAIESSAGAGTRAGSGRPA
jgi:lipid-A-disaccharide synthase